MNSPSNTTLSSEVIKLLRVVSLHVKLYDGTAIKTVSKLTGLSRAQNHLHTHSQHTEEWFLSEIKTTTWKYLQASVCGQEKGQSSHCTLWRSWCSWRGLDSDWSLPYLATESSVELANVDVWCHLRCSVVSKTPSWAWQIWHRIPRITVPVLSRSWKLIGYLQAIQIPVGT